ncbi:MAG: ECF transporter S component [Candidatus Promineifilaceae bacterium]|nr:ECF transporter S component [Candidatus Promineifilaceae bacterium]
MRGKFNQDLLTISIYLVAGITGIAVFIYPFILINMTSLNSDLLQTQENLAPVVTLFLLLISLFALLLEAQGQAVSAKLVASLGILVAGTATLRFIEVAIPGPGGFSPIFVPIILAGYVFGSRFGFLLGTMTVLVSALLTGGVGPWLPYQMFLAGWIGLTSGWLPHFKNARAELFLLVTVGVIWGILYGFIMNLYYWPFIAGEGAANLEEGMGVFDSVMRYLTFYLATSLVWDLARAAGNGLLIAVLGLATVRVFTRFRDKFQFEVRGA